MTSTSELHRKGNPRLVNAIAETYKGILNREIDANKEILITSGAYASLFYCHQGFIHKGDEVIFFFNCINYPCFLMSNGFAFHCKWNRNRVYGIW